MKNFLKAAATAAVVFSVLFTSFAHAADKSYTCLLYTSDAADE